MTHKILIEYDDETGTLELMVQVDPIEMASGLATMLQINPKLMPAVTSVQAIVTAALALTDGHRDRLSPILPRAHPSAPPPNPDLSCLQN